MNKIEKQHQELRQLRKQEPFKTILKGWTVRFNSTSKHKAKVWINEKTKQAIIYEWGKGKIPSDFILHELLHVAFRSIHNKKKKEYKYCEEMLIQYLCYRIECQN